MNELEELIAKIIDITAGDAHLSIQQERKIVEELNDFFFATHDGIGTVPVLGQNFQYFSDFHKYWHKHHKEILNVRINDKNCEKVADALHDVYLRTGGRAFTEVYNTCGLTKKEICQIRFLTANQDFNGSRSFSDLVERYKKNPTAFSVRQINSDPDAFIKTISVTKLSQTDKRASYAKNITQFLIEHNVDPFDIIDCFDRDVFRFREVLIAYEGAGYGNKKTDMFIRDMIVLGVWTDVKGFEKIDVASDVNTIRIALKSGILNCEIPLISSFIDIFSYQYDLIDNQSAQAWRRVWKIWKAKYPSDNISSPCLLDYFVYNVLGRQFCKENLCWFECDNGHKFPNAGARSKYCPVCKAEHRGNVETTLISRDLPCSCEEGKLVIEKSPFSESRIAVPPLTQCPLKNICDECGKKQLNAPKSISIRGQTGWESAYSKRGTGGGGLMA